MTSLQRIYIFEQGVDKSLVPAIEIRQSQTHHTFYLLYKKLEVLKGFLIFIIQVDFVWFYGTQWDWLQLQNT